MKRILAASIAFFIGISIQAAFRAGMNFLNSAETRITTVAPVIVEPLFELPSESTLEEALQEEVVFNPSGYYMPVQSKGLEQDTRIDLHTETEEEKIDAGIYTANGYYAAQRIKVTEKKLSFSTEKIRGAHYEFEGVFLEALGDSYDEPVLEGTLRKFRNGKKVFEKKVRFTYYMGC